MDFKDLFNRYVAVTAGVLIALVISSNYANAQERRPIEASVNLSPCIEGLIIEDGQEFSPTLVTDSIVQGALTRHIQIKANCGGIHDVRVSMGVEDIHIDFKPGGKHSLEPDAGDGGNPAMELEELVLMECDCCYVLSVTLDKIRWIRFKEIIVNGQPVAGFPE